MRLALAALGVALLALAGCEDEQGWTTHPVSIADGTYHVAHGQGIPADDAATVLATKFRVDRAEGKFVVVPPLGPETAYGLSFRPREEWIGDCYTMSSSTLDEWAELSPAPLTLGSMTFETPLVYAKCSPQRLVLADAPNDETKGLALDLE